MSEVIIVLDLKRRSGVLAAAVAAVHRAGLEFQSQRMVDEQGSPRLILNATGEPHGADEIVEVFSNIGGVAEVADVQVDGQSLMHGLPEPEPETAPEPDPEPEKEPEPDPEPEPAPEPVREPEPEPTPVEEPDPEPTPKKASDDTEARQAEPVTRPAEAAGESSAELKPSMVRRRRRRR